MKYYDFYYNNHTSCIIMGSLIYFLFFLPIFISSRKMFISPKQMTQDSGALYMTDDVLVDNHMHPLFAKCVKDFVLCIYKDL